MLNYITKHILNYFFLIWTNLTIALMQNSKLAKKLNSFEPILV
jgi:hypothetical protein